MNIAGTVSYEDSTNVDSVGVVTARKQLHVGTGVSVAAGGLNVTAGITTVQALQATTGTFSAAVSGTTGTFSGAVSGTTGTFSAAVSGTTGTFSGAVSGTTGTSSGDVSIADKIAHTGDSNTHLRFSNTDEFLATVGGKETFRIASAGRVGILTDTFEDNGCKLVVEGRDNSTTSAARIQVKGNGNGYVHSAIDLVATNSYNASGGQRGLGMFMYDSAASKEWFAGNPYGSADNFIIARKASGSRTVSAEQAAGVTLFKVDSSGNVGLNTTAPQNSANYSTLTLTGTQIGGGQIAFKGGSNVHYVWTPGADFNIGCDYAGLGGGGLNFKVNGNNTRMSIAGSGQVTINDGDLVIGTSGHGIDFSATSDASGMTSELLDDYEEGVWIPVHGSSGGSVVGGGTYTCLLYTSPSPRD